MPTWDSTRCWWQEIAGHFRLGQGTYLQGPPLSSNQEKKKIIKENNNKKQKIEINKRAMNKSINKADNFISQLTNS